MADGERKTVTALFADVKGSMELMADLDPEEARAIVDPALKLMIDAVRRYDGYVVQRPAMGFSHCSARRSRTRTIRSALCTPHSGWPLPKTSTTKLTLCGLIRLLRRTCG